MITNAAPKCPPVSKWEMVEGLRLFKKHGVSSLKQTFMLCIYIYMYIYTYEYMYIYINNHNNNDDNNNDNNNNKQIYIIIYISNSAIYIDGFGAF